MDEIVGYIHSWSCYKNYCQVNGDHAGLQLIDELKEKYAAFNLKVEYHRKTQLFACCF